MTSPSRNLPLLVPKAANDPDIATWATVTQTSPLRIKLDGESQQLPFTPSTLVSQLSVNDRVWVALSTNASPSTKARRALIIGRATASNSPTLVMNLAQDPGATAFHSTPGRLGWRSTRWFGSGGAGTYSIVSVTDPKGGTSLAARKTWTTAPSGNGDTGFECSYGWSATDTQGFSGIRGGYIYTLSGYLRSSAGGSKVGLARIQWHDSAGAIISTSNGPGVVLTANVWARVSLTVTAPSNAVYATCIIDNGNQGTTWAVGNTLDGTWLMLTGGSNLWEYMDGGQPGGIWLGTANASYSQGYTVAQ